LACLEHAVNAPDKNRLTHECVPAPELDAAHVRGAVERLARSALFLAEGVPHLGGRAHRFLLGGHDPQDRHDAPIRGRDVALGFGLAGVLGLELGLGVQNHVQVLSPGRLDPLEPPLQHGELAFAPGVEPTAELVLVLGGDRRHAGAGTREVRDEDVPAEGRVALGMHRILGVVEGVDAVDELLGGQVQDLGPLEVRGEVPARCELCHADRRRRGETRLQRGEQGGFPHRLRRVKKEAGVADDAARGRALETGGEAVLKVDFLLELPRHREGELAAVGRRDRPEGLDHDGHLRPEPLEPAGKRAEIMPGGRPGVHEEHPSGHLGRRLDELAGLFDALLVLRDFRLERGESFRVALRSLDEGVEEIALGVLRNLRPLRIEGRERRQGADSEPAERRQRFRRLGRARVEDGSVLVDAVVDDTEGLHGPGQTVQVGIGDNHRPFLGELTDRDQRGAGGIRLPVRDLGVVSELPQGLGRGLDLLLPRIAGGGRIVVVANDTPDASRLQGGDRVGQERGCGGVDEDDPLRPLGDGLDHGLRVGRRKDLRKESGGRGDGHLEHVRLLANLPPATVGASCFEGGGIVELWDFSRSPLWVHSIPIIVGR